jgi:hypothetical protein
LNRIYSIFKSRHLWGLTATAVVLYLLVFKALAGIDVSWLMPPTDQIARAIIDIWPRMPFFAVQRESSPEGKEIYYTVPTRQLTPSEMTQLGLTNHMAKPAPPAKPAGG